MSKRVLILMCSIFLVVPLMFYGCGDDGDAGAPGATGATGPTGPAGGAGGLSSSPNPESCDVCHGVGQIRDVTAVHAVTWVPLVSNVTTALQGDGTLLISFRAVTTTTQNNTTVPFVATPTDNLSGYVNIDNAALPNSAPPDNILRVTKFQRISVSGATLAAAATAGDYTITVPVNRVFDNASYVFRITGTSGPTFIDFAGRPTQVRPVVVANYNGNHLRDLVTSGTAANPTGCANCHGPYPAYSTNFPHYAVGGAECQICHSSNATGTTASGAIATTQRDPEARTLLDNGSISAVKTGLGANLTEYVHGIHNSHNMPGGTYFRSTPAAGETIEDLTTEDKYSVGYPSDMRNCNVCHVTDVQREAAASAPVSYYLCMTCHQNFDGFVRHTGEAVFAANDFHRDATPTTNCMSCHAALASINEASDFHNFFESADAHLNSFYRGEDISFNNNDNVLFRIVGVQKSGDNVSFTWRATKNGAAVNPCDNNLSTGPSFRGLGAQLAYFKGDDLVNENVSATQAPGQPAGSRNLFTSLSTTCDNTNLATTTGLVVAQGPKAYAKKALLAVVGKPLDRGTFLIGTTDQQRDFFVRSPSQTFGFNMADGSAATPRRSAVDSDKCNRCHRGTLYQHGGERVDNEQLCVICHNPSSSEKNVRKEFYNITNAADNTVNTSATYDGKVAETYDMRYLIHAIHGAEKREKPLIIYRSRGIFSFAPPVYNLVGNERFAVDHPRPTGWPALEGVSQPVFGSRDNDNQAHTWTTIHYPKPFNECIACHTGNEYFDPVDQTQAVALTVDPGTSYPSQTDDIVIGPTAAACTACHESAGAAGIPVQRHATFDFGYKANVAKEVMLEKASAVALGPDITP